MSEQLLQALTVINSQVNEDVGESFVDGISSILGQIECGDDERVILVSLAVASQRVSMQYSAELARDVRGRELAATGVVQILLQVANDDGCDYPSRLLASALARELGGIIEIVDALEINPMDPRRLCLDGPLP